MKKRLEALIKIAETSGLPQSDLDTATEFLFHHEYGLCFDTIATQMYENNINIDLKTYSAISEAAMVLKIPIDDYSYINDLIIIE
ncbi:MafI family immunity protein [Pedobacter sp. WC2501]|uniref:MafI family immunity protein n=1 Tax=Pedobacter sp. WC2501 TaxID=3461400 RepID=UPI004045DD46